MSEQRPSEQIVARLREKAAKGGVIPINDVTLLAAADYIENLEETVMRAFGYWPCEECGK